MSALERDVQATILDLAHTLGWRSYHVFDSRRSAGGFPDLVLVRDRVVFAEVKRAGEKPRADQVEWLDDLAAAGGEVYLWTLDDLGEIAVILSARHRVRAASEWLPGASGHGERRDVSRRVPRRKRTP